MTSKQQRLNILILQAIENFNNNESYLIKNDLSERCICAKFASYVEKEIQCSQFSDYIVDVEYNRGYHGKDFNPKMLNGRKIVVDLIVHKRAYDENAGYDNLICIEMKKQYKNFDLSSDKNRLRVLTDDVFRFGYEIGFMIVAEQNKSNNTYGLRINDTFCNAARHDIN